MKINGSKTYILSITIAMLGLLFSLDVIDNDAFVAILTILTGGAFASTRHAISKAEN